MIWLSTKINSIIFHLKDIETCLELQFSELLVV